MSTLHPKNQPKHRYQASFDGDAYCSCAKPCGVWTYCHETIDMDGKHWTTLGTGMFSSRAEVIEYLVDNKKPTDWTDYPVGQQAILGITGD